MARRPANRSFVLSAAKVKKHWREKARLKFIGLTLFAHARLVYYSPVDTGFFRGQWNVSINDAPPRKTVQRPDDMEAYMAEAGALGGSVTAKLMGAQLGDKVWVFNPTVYAMALERGHSQQAPNGMLALTVAELRTRYKDVAGRARR